MRTFDKSRKYNDNDRLKSVFVRAANRADNLPEYPEERKTREIVVTEEGAELLRVILKPWGRCDQWCAVFPGGEIKGGMDEIHAEIRRVMPPRRGM